MPWPGLQEKDLGTAQDNVKNYQRQLGDADAELRAIQVGAPTLPSVFLFCAICCWCTKTTASAQRHRVACTGGLGLPIWVDDLGDRMGLARTSIQNLLAESERLTEAQHKPC